MKTRICFLQSVLVLTILLTTPAVFAQSSSFTYQGRLTDGGTAANGNYDLQFALWDSASGGSQVGSTLTVSSVAVSNGVFAVTLDFGANSFPGAGRFLEISARTIGAGSLTLLTPRQQVTSTPYAVRSTSSASADNATNATNATTATNATQLGGIAAGQYVQTNDSRLTDPRSPTAGSANYIQNTSGAQTASFNISGNGTVAGTLSGNVVNAAAQYNIGGNRVFAVSGNVANFLNSNTFAGINAGVATTPVSTGEGNFNSFFGFTAGTANTTGLSNSFFGTVAGNNNTSGSSNSFFGEAAGFTNTTGRMNSFFGSAAGQNNTTGTGNSCFGGFLTCQSNTTGSYNTLLGTDADVAPGNGNLINATAIGAGAIVTQSNSLVLGTNGFQTISSFGTFTAGPTNVGIGIGAPLFRLHVVDAGAAGLRVQTNASGGTVASFGGFGDFQIDSNGVAGGRLIVTQSGRVGISTGSPTSTLSVNGTADKPGGGSWGTFSDERLKNITGRFTPGLRAIMRLQPLRYEYKADNALGIKAAGEHIGFSAQQVQQIIPEAVSQNDKGYLLVNNDPILWTMLNAIKEQQTQIEALRQANAALNVHLRNLEQRRRKRVASKPRP